MVPLETMAIRNRTNSPRGSPEGHRNPEFINDNKDDEDDDIYKTQLLLFLKQHHLVAPGYGQDSASVTSEQSRRQSREASAYSEQNNQDDYNYGDHQGAYENEEIDVDSIQIADVSRSLPSCLLIFPLKLCHKLQKYVNIFPIIGN